MRRPHEDTDDDAETEHQLRQLGASDEQIAERRAAKAADRERRKAAERYEVFPANWRAVTLFAERGFRCIERSIMDGKPIGLRVEAVEALLRIEEEGQNRELFDQLMLIGDGVAMGPVYDS